MSSRAIRALRGDAGALLQTNDNDDDSNEDDDDDNDEVRPQATAKRSTFSMAAAALILEEDDDDESDSSSSPKEDDTGDNPDEPIASATTRAATGLTPADIENDNSSDSEEDLDQLLNEFHQKDRKDGNVETNESNEQGDFNVLSQYAVLLTNFDSKDVDYDYTMLTSLSHFDLTNSNRRRKKPSGRKNMLGSSSYLFGPPRDGWVKPPHLIGGGIGMKVYASPDGRDETHDVIPWPYNCAEVLINNNKTSVHSDDSEEDFTSKKFDVTKIRRNWFTYLYSDTYQRDCHDYKTIVEQSGDLNALVMFVAHHPFCCPAILQLSTALYQTNHSTEGLALLHRCLYIYESAMSMIFKQQKLYGYTATLQSNDDDDDNATKPSGSSRNNNSRDSDCCCFLDYDKEENKIFFQSLRKLIQVSYIAGLTRTSLAASRLILSLDPLRDPLGILLVMDRFVISCGEVSVDALKWFIDIVDSDTMQIIYQENHETNSAITNPKKLYQCGICDLPNIAYSYALALFKLYTLGDSIDEDIKTKSNHAIQAAMNRFPLIVGRILEHLSIDTTGRSFRRDWVTVLEYATELSRKLDIEWSSYSGRESDEQYYDAITLSATMQACERVTKNYVTYCSKFWNDEAILHWMYTNLKELKDLHTTSMPVLPKPPNPAIIRYLEFDASDYDDKITTLPPEVAMIDPGLIAYAMTMNTNRARFARQVQQNRRGGRAGGNDDMDFVEENGRRIMADGGGAGGFGSTVLGPPTNIVDPDWPLVEVFWRSFLPWNHVDGVPPPRR